MSKVRREDLNSDLQRMLYDDGFEFADSDEYEADEPTTVIVPVADKQDPPAPPQ